MADLHIGQNGDPLTAYVAVTRVTGRDKLAILRPFDPKPYQQGTRLGRVLLLKVWRGEDIEWEALRSTFLEEKRCAECGVLKRKNEYTAGQWKIARTKKGFVKNALRATWRMGRRGNARYVPVGGSPASSRPSTKGRNAHFTACA